MVGNTAGPQQYFPKREDGVLDESRKSTFGALQILHWEKRCARVSGEKSTEFSDWQQTSNLEDKQDGDTNDHESVARSGRGLWGKIVN